MTNPELPIIQKTYDLIVWYVPRINKFPRDYRFTLGDRVQGSLYELLEGLLRARFMRDRQDVLASLNATLDVLRYQTRLCRHFDLIDERRYEFVSGLIHEIGTELGGWIRAQRKRT